MEFKDPWGGSAPSSRQLSPRLTGPSSNAFSTWTTADFLWLRQGRAAAHTVYSNTILAIFRVCFFSSLQDLKPSVGRLDARVHTWLSGVASLLSAEILFPRALCHVPLGLPTPAPPTPANGHVSVNTEDEKHAILNVSLSPSHISFYCVSWLCRTSKFPGTLPTSAFRGFRTFDNPLPRKPEGTGHGLL